MPLTESLLELWLVFLAPLRAVFVFESLGVGWSGGHWHLLVNFLHFLHLTPKAFATNFKAIRFFISSTLSYCFNFSKIGAWNFLVITLCISEKSHLGKSTRFASISFGSSTTLNRLSAFCASSFDFSLVTFDAKKIGSLCDSPSSIFLPFLTKLNYF